ncbi:MAG: hypothetical protein AAF827_06855 [Cyanobacteria bacterium P01_D01_bin.6]
MNRRFVYTLPGIIGIGLLATLAPLTEVLPAAIGKQVSAQAQVPSTMTVERLGAMLQAETDDVQGSAGQWQLTLEDQTVIVLADADSNRMRIFTPIAAAETLSVNQVEAILAANFHSALDARYAVTAGTLVAVYVHPLSSLQAHDFRSALRQVATLAATFGTTYTSGELGFGPGAGPADERKVPAGLIDI